MKMLRTFWISLLSFMFYRYVKYRELKEVFSWVILHRCVVRVWCVNAEPGADEEVWGTCTGWDRTGRLRIGGYFVHNQTTISQVVSVRLEEIARVIVYVPDTFFSERPITLCELYLGVVQVEVKDGEG